MIKILTLAILLCPTLTFCQTHLKEVSKKSHQVFAYKVNATQAEKFIKKDSIDVDAFLLETPVAIFPVDSVDQKKLPIGQYVLISIEDNRIKANLIGISDLMIYPVNNRQRLQLSLIDRQGNFVNDAKIRVNGIEAPFRTDAQSYLVQQKNPDTALIIVYTQKDTLFSSVWVLDELEKSVHKQKLENFKKTRFVRSISWIPVKISHLFKKKYHYKPSNAGTSGLIVFNQPKYRPTDTVKLKAYIFDRNWKVYTHPVDLFLEYYSRGKNNKVCLKRITHAAPGSYIFQFPLSDSLQSDISYSVVFRTLDGRRILEKNFRIEDYLLDEISTYNFRSDKEAYYLNDSLHFYASALNANGLPVLDASAKLTVTTETINKFYPDSLYVPDTLLVAEKALLTNGETIFSFPTDKFPKADLYLSARIEFKNGNNELQYKDLSFSYRVAERELNASVAKDSVMTVFTDNGKIVPAKGFVRIENNWDEIRQVHYPCKIKIDPLALSYTFYLVENGKILDSAKPGLLQKYEVGLTRVSRADTLGFVLDNPLSIPVTFTVFDGNKIIGIGKGSNNQIRWAIKCPNKRQVYRVSWQYRWLGEEQIREKTIALLYKLLDIQIKNNSQVFPGQKDSITIEVRDYKNRPVPAVNLTALSYNSQFIRDISVPDPPYLVRYKIRPTIKRNKFDPDDPFITRNYPLGNHTGWILPFGLDTMPYYKMHFPGGRILDLVTPIAEFLPQLSVHIAQKGERKEIYLLYVNRDLVYYNGVTDKMNDAWQTYLGYTQIGIRLYDQFIEIDSIYMQPAYKHDLFIDIDHLPANAKTTKCLPVLTSNERSLLEQSCWNLAGNINTNSGYIWQSERLVHLSGNQSHLTGPFHGSDSLHFFALRGFDIHFIFEPGYQYNLSKQILRLEKKKIFPDNEKEIKLPEINTPQWTLGDTIPNPPTVTNYIPPVNKEPFLKLSNYNDYLFHKEGDGHIYFTIAKDTTLRYIILLPAENPAERLVMPANTTLLGNIRPGVYNMLLVDKSGNTAEIKQLFIRPDQTLCIHADHVVYKAGHPLVTEWTNEITRPLTVEMPDDIMRGEISINRMPDYAPGTGIISGRVLDKKGGHGIAGVTVMIKQSRTGTNTNPDGTFSIHHIKPGKCMLSIASIGYITKEVEVNVPDQGVVNIDISLILSTMSLNEVVVVGYGTQKRQSLSYSVAAVQGEELSRVNMLQGKVAGISIIQEVQPGAEFNIVLRGIGTELPGQHPIYVIDGIIYDKMPANIPPDMIESVNTLKDAEATALYGAKAAEGVIVVTTKMKNIRTKFRDYAFWQPELITDRHGIAAFLVEYPDNITGWQTYILGMDKKRRMGKAFTFTNSYKPLMAQLSLPQFLIAGDTVGIIGKALNYNKDDYSLQTGFTIEGQKTIEQSVLLKAKESSIQKYTVIAPAKDSLQAAFNIRSNTGFKDGEERRIPILPKGSKETSGECWILDQDTAISYQTSMNSESIECYAQNNTLDLLLNEINNLRRYPYDCMEQTASKLRGLLMERTIKERLHQPFSEEKTIGLLINRLQKNQQYDGGWGWWEHGKTNLFITNYVVRALIPLRSQGMIETNIRNGLLYLQNQLPALNREELLNTLLTMSEARHLINYQIWLNKLSFDSLNINEQWQFIRIMQLQNTGHANNLTQLMKKAIPGMLGSLHWGEETYRWYNDDLATTVNAFEVLQKEPGQDKALKGIIQYFLENRRTGYWTNTVASASIVSALLPYVLSLNKEYMKPAVLTITGDTSYSIRQYPFKLVIHNNNIQHLNVQKTGGGLTFFTLYQQHWNINPQPVRNHFDIHSYFEKDRSKTITLHAGERIRLITEVNVLQEAEFVMIEIPVPAGCTYGSKEQDDWNDHKEFLKYKAVIFAERLTKGVHRYVLNLETRYEGKFTLNPAQAALMYFPTFFGRNEMQQIDILPD